MPRGARVILPGVPLHIVHRGNNRGECFFADADRRFYLCQLGEHLERFGCALHAFCLMSNHVHLLLTPDYPDSAALLMKRVAQRHAQYINRIYRRSGTLWEGRFRSCLVESECYLLACYRYIESNPVRAGLVSGAADYEWSSYRTNAQGLSNRFISPHPEYLRLGNAFAERLAVYRAQFARSNACAACEDEAIRNATKGGNALGGGAFRRHVSRVLGRRVEAGEPGRPRTRESRLEPQRLLFEPSD
jgi:putative transposase